LKCNADALQSDKTGLISTAVASLHQKRYVFAYWTDPWLGRE